ncbi:MAG: hypothetical protein H7839_00875 [Magnetococcus sp. YQC-5]
MRITKTITVGEPSREVIIREPTVAEMRQWLIALEADRAGTADIITYGLIPDTSLTDIVLMTDLTMKDLDTMVASEIKAILEACKEMNPDFFTLRAKKMLMIQMDAHAIFSALSASEQWTLANVTTSE